MGAGLETIFDIADNLSQSTIRLTESFSKLKTLIDEAKNQIKKERTDFVAKLLENKWTKKRK